MDNQENNGTPVTLTRSTAPVQQDEGKVEKVLPTSNPVEKVSSEPTVKITDEDIKVGSDPSEKDTGVDMDAIINEYKESVKARGNQVSYRNLDKVAPSIPLNSREDNYEYSESILGKVKDAADLSDQYEDFNSEYRKVRGADEFYSEGNDILRKAISHVDVDKLVSNIEGIREGVAAVASKHLDNIKNGNNVVSGPEGYRIFATLTAGVRKVVCYNSGLTLTVHAVPIRIMDEFLEACSSDQYEYGKEYGAWYFIFAGLKIDRHICDRILKYAIIGSNYRDFNSNDGEGLDKLLNQLSLQDYQVVLWTLVCLMYPMGMPINYVCANHGCGHVHTEKVDLGKLRLNNRDLISDAMIQHFARNKFVTDADLAAYREEVARTAEAHGVKQSFTIDLPEGDGVVQKYEIFLKPCSVREHLDAGDEYNARLQESVKISDREEVFKYISHNKNLSYRSWISKIQVTILQDGKDTLEHPIIIENKLDGSNNETIDMILDTFQQRLVDFETPIQNYILDSKISHIAFYFEKCPKCGTAPVLSYKGFIPYDMTQAFFTLGRMKVWKINLAQNEQQDGSNTSTATVK